MGLLSIDEINQLTDEDMEEIVKRLQKGSDTLTCSKAAFYYDTAAIALEILDEKNKREREEEEEEEEEEE